MSVKATYKDGVFKPLENVEDAAPGRVYTVFSEEELRDMRETLGWLKVAEKSFDFWNNQEDAVYDPNAGRCPGGNHIQAHQRQQADD
jgi:predicted DNA-binding antitoxin AbrB/MazE fold protein